MKIVGGSNDNMRNRILTLALAMVFGLTTVLAAGCGGDEDSTEEISEAVYTDTTIYGEVTAVGDSSITIDVGTYTENEYTEVGESVTVEVSDDTVITKMSNTMGGDAPDGMGGDAPDGEAPDGAGGEMTTPEDGTEMGEMPDGNAPSDMGGESIEGSTEMGDMDAAQSGEAISLSDISVGDIVSVTYDSDGAVSEIVVISSSDDSNGGMEGGGDSAQSGGTSSGVDSYTAVVEYTEDTEVDGESYTSTGTDENAILVNGADVVLSNITVDRTSSDRTGGENSSIYGVGAALLALTGSLTIDNAVITTDAAGGAGVFSYGDAVVYVSNSTITTQQDTSGGIHVAGGGTLYAWDLTVETNGESAAAIRSDRGGGTMVVDGGTYTSNGTGSPAVYCTADIAINNATLTSTNSEAVCIEGLNSLHIFNSDLTGSIHDSSQNDCSWNVILYQSMSGDSEVGNSTFEMQGGSITAENGGMFYTTNTESTFILKNVDITCADDSEFFLKVTGNSNERGWGTSGANGADCTFTAIEQEMEGAVIWDSISTLEFYMTDGSTLTGYVEDDESNAGSGGDGYCNFYIDSTSTWIVTGDSVLTALYCEGTITDESGNTVTIQGSDGTVYVSGTSTYTITVDTYETSADFSGASETSDWSDYEAAQP